MAATKSTITFPPRLPPRCGGDAGLQLDILYHVKQHLGRPQIGGGGFIDQLMDDRFALGDLAAFSVDRDEDAPSLPSPACGGGLGWGQRIGEQRMQLLSAAAAGVAGLAPLLKRVWMGGLR